MLQPRKCKTMGKIATSYLIFFVLAHSVLGNQKEAYRDSVNEKEYVEEIHVDRVKRDGSGVTTVLLIDNDDDSRIGRSDRPSGVLTSTARTFVHDGTTTEYGTQIIGTTVNDGKYYAQILQTSSRIYFGEQEKNAPKLKLDDKGFQKTIFQGFSQTANENHIPSSVFYKFRPSEPVFIYPSATVNSLNSEKIKGSTQSDELNIKSHESKSGENKKELLIAHTGDLRQLQGKSKVNKERELLENLIRLENIDLLHKQNVDSIKPTKVLSNLLPTVTIRHDFAPSGFSLAAEEKQEEVNIKSEKSKLRSGKSFLNKPVEKKYDTVTYLGFADFITTVGNTVIVFMPSTRAGDQSVKPTSIVEETVQKPENEIKTTIKTFMSHSPGMVTRTIPGHSLSMQTSIPTSVADRQSKGLNEDFELKSSALAKEQILFDNPVLSSGVSDSSEIIIEPSESMSYSSISRTESATEPLATFATTITKTFNAGGSDKPLGLLKSVGGTKAYNGTTTHFTSLVYGTYVDGSYAQILKTSSSIFYLLESPGGISATVVLDQLKTALPELTSSTTDDTTTSVSATSESENEEELLETSEKDEDEEKPFKEVGFTTVKNILKAKNKTTETKLKDKTKEEEFTDKKEVLLNIHDDSKKSEKIFQTATEDLITRLVPSTVYKTFTYLTTFFIPKGDTTTTSIRSREVVSSDVNLVTKIIDPNLVFKDIPVTSTTFIPTQINSVDFEDDEEFHLPEVRVLAPEDVVIIEDTEDQEIPDAIGTTEIVTENNLSQTPSGDLTNSPQPDSKTTDTTSSKSSSDIATQTDLSSKATNPLNEGSTTATNLENTENINTPAKAAESTTPENPDTEDEEIEVIFKTLYTTYTYLTTFFHESTTSISSSEVVVTNIVTSTLQNAIEPTLNKIIEATPTLKEGATPTKLLHQNKDDEEVLDPTNVRVGKQETKFFDEDEENEGRITLSPSHDIPETTVTETPSLKFDGVKTFYTTYTYFTTLFDEGSTDVISRTEVITNVVGSNTLSVLPSSILQNEELLKSKFEMLLKEQQSQRAAAAAAASRSSEIPLSSIRSNAKNNPSSSYFASPSSTTSLFSGSSTYPSSTSILKYNSDTNKQSQSIRGSSIQRSNIRPSASVKGKFVNFTRKYKGPINITATSEYEEDNSLTRSIIRGDKKDRTVVRKRIRTKSRLLSKTANIDDNLGVTTIRLDPTPIDDRILFETMVTDVTSSSSGGGRQIRIAPPEPIDRIGEFLYDDQISSESNTEEIEPSPTYILQTSYTTFTYFTTVYKGTSSSDIISRLETVTNIVTESVKPELLVTENLSPEDATLPITYFTTFTYWTTLYKDSNTIITSREETVSNVVTPTLTLLSSPTAVLDKTVIRPVSKVETSSASPLPSPKVIISELVPAATPPPITETQELETNSPINTKPIENLAGVLINKDGIIGIIEPTTYFTTYTYFTTSYVGDSTVLKSRLETVTNVVLPTPTITEISENDLQTGRAINAASANVVIKSEEEKNLLPNQTSSDSLQTGLLSTEVSSAITDGKTTLYSTDIFGTFIDGLYAKILESTTKIISEVEITPTSSTEAQKTGVVSINEGKIIDADGVSTTFYTTKAIGTSIEDLYAQVVESTSSVLVDVDKKSALADLQGDNQNEALRTGLVRLIEGSIVQDGNTTFYESRILGTIIDGNYAQIIESTSSFKIEPSIAPSVTIKEEVTPTSSAVLDYGSPSAIESSVADEISSTEFEHEDFEEENEDDNKDNKDTGRVKSRLTFQTKKRTFTPVIRPFASRNRPTFLPKKKPLGTTGAQTITRTNFTPTITATPATKTEGYNAKSLSNRFGSGRKGASNLNQEVKPTASSSRKFGRNRTSFSSPTISPTYSPSRGRGTPARVSPTPSLHSSSARGRGGFRGASSRASFNLENNGLKSTLAPNRPRIRPTLSGRATAPTIPPNDRNNDLNDFSSEDEEGGFTVEDNGDSIATTTTTTEDPNLARRNNNPLLRFRRPLIPKASTTTTTPKPATTSAPRRGILSGRNNRVTSAQSLTTPRSSNRASQNLARANLPGRSRPVNNLFPPRGLFKKPQELEKEEDEIVEEEEEENLENEDNNYEESTAKEVETEVENKKIEKQGRGRTLNPVQIRPFNFQRRSKRQTSEYGSRNRQYSDSVSFSPRYRRPKTKSVQAEERIDYYDEEYLTPEPPKIQQNGRTYTSRNRGRIHQNQTPNPPTQSRIRPTTASSQSSQRALFTLREKDTSSNPRTTNFRRGQSTPSRRKSNSFKATEPTIARKSSRNRIQSQNSPLNDLSRNNQRRGYSNRGRPTSSRSRSRFGEIEDSFTFQPPAFDGTITVTHKIPSEVTIPIVNGKSTEYRNVITAKPSIEVLGPHQYTVTSTNGGTLLFLNREVTETLNNGVTEVTKFLIHETPTTSVIFTPTTIRGRKTSFSHIIPSTVYDVENVVTSIQPQLAANAPLANILLSQLLLGNLNIPQNQAHLGIPQIPQPQGAATPTTEFKTRTTTYVTSVTDQISTVLPITFRGKEILTTIVDSTVNVITATEYITDTVVITPTLNPNQQINSLLLPALLQAQFQQVTPPQIPSPAFTPLPFPPALGLDQLKLEALQQQGLQIADLTDDKIKASRGNDIRQDKEYDDENVEKESEEAQIQQKSKPLKKSDRKKVEPEPAKEIVTLYVSGRRPGEFSTIVSTVINGETSVNIKKREIVIDDIDRLLLEASEAKQIPVLSSKEIILGEDESKNENSYLDYYVTPGMSEVNIHVESKEINSETQSLESVLGDVSKHVTSSKTVPTSKIYVKPTQNGFRKNTKKIIAKPFSSKSINKDI